jgi:hypothetical protein
MTDETRSFETSDDPPARGVSVFELWCEYEKVAMHFNDLIIRLRTQSLGGVAAVATVAAVFARGDITHDVRWGVMAATFFLLLLFWFAVWVLDFGYYNRLLLGAVDALIALEEQSGTTAVVTKITLSSMVESRMRRRSTLGRGSFSRSYGRWIFYSTVSAGLFVCLVAAVIQLGGLPRVVGKLF